MDTNRHHLVLYKHRYIICIKISLIQSCVMPLFSWANCFRPLHKRTDKSCFPKHRVLCSLEEPPKVVKRGCKALKVLLPVTSAFNTPHDQVTLSASWSIWTNTAQHCCSYWFISIHTFIENVNILWNILFSLSKGHCQCEKLRSINLDVQYSFLILSMWIFC